MRINLESGLPIVVTPDGFPTVITVDGLAFSSAGKGTLIRNVGTSSHRGSHAGSWTKAYGNPFIDGSWTNWFRDDPTYDRPTLEQMDERLERKWDLELEQMDERWDPNVNKIRFTNANKIRFTRTNN